MLRTMRSTSAIAISQLQAFEQAIEVELPEDYRNFLLTHNGGAPEPSAVAIAWSDRLDKRSIHHECARRFPWNDVDFLYGIGRESWCELLVKWQCYFGRVPADTIPIGNDPGPNLLLLGIKGPRRGQVLFWVSDYESEQDIEPNNSNVGLVAASFGAFLDSLFDV